MSPAGAAASAGRGDALPRPAVPLVHETAFYPTVIDAAHVAGWRVAHFRPAQTKHGWRTAVQGDGKGFPDFVLVHGGAARVWFVELKVDGARLSDDQRAWGETLIASGAVFRTVHCPSGLQTFLQDLIDAVRPC